MHIRIAALVNESAWGIGHKAPEPSGARAAAEPSTVDMTNGWSAYSFDNNDSQRIWLSATHFQDATD